MSEEESSDQNSRRTFSEEPSVGTSDEDKCLRDLGDLEVDDHVKSEVVRIRDVDDTELVREESSVDNDEEESLQGSHVQYRCRTK